MIYQLSLINNKHFVTSCNSTSNDTIDPYLVESRDNLKYIGLEKETRIAFYLKVIIYKLFTIYSILFFSSFFFKDYVIILLVLTLQSIIKLKLKYYRIKYRLSNSVYNIIYEDVTCDHLDKNIKMFFKYIVNFCFYKFGLEVNNFLFINLYFLLSSLYYNRFAL